jgi:type IX secretion system PorP/SprF family membrane protein
MKKLYIFILLILSAHILPAQLSGVSNMYAVNHYLINSAAAGKDSTLEIFTGYRKQWSGISNSPSLGYLGITGRIGKNQGAGLLVEQSKYGLLSDLNAKLSYAYRVRLSLKNSLYAGASVGFINRRFKTSGVIASDYSDELLLQNTLTGTNIVSDIGIMFISQRLSLGVALPQIIRQNNTDEAGFPGHYILHGSYDVMSNVSWKLQVIGAYRKTVQQKSQTDIGLRIFWKDQFGGGVGYRTIGGMFVRTEIKVRNLLSFGYAYEHGTSSTGRSHEAMVNIRFGNKKKISSGI